MTDVSPELAARVEERCRMVLATNWLEGERDGVRFAFTQPDPQRYPWQWYWDSCLIAVARRRHDPDGARAELETLLAAARPDGFIGHTIFWNQPLRFPRRLFYNVLSPRDFMTSTIQPPMLAWAWRIAVGDPREHEGIVRHHDRVEADRDLDGDGLIWILQPDESGLDASPEFDAIWGRRAQGLPGFVALVRHNRRLGFDIRRVREHGGPLVCSVQVNTLHGLSRLALGRPSITPAIVDRLYDERTGLFGLDAWPAREGRRPLTWAALAPLALPDLPEDIGRRLVEEHLLDPSRFWLPVPVPSVAADEPSFSLSDTHLGLRRYWRGPTWVSSAWLIWLGLRRLGYDDVARELTARLAIAADREGLREYYDPYTGAGMGARKFGWSALIGEMLAEDPRAAGSYLEGVPAGS